MSDTEEEIDENESSAIERKTVFVGTRDGLGKVLFASGNQFEGEFVDGLKHGRGVFSFISGARYEGDWIRGVKHGIGEFTYPDGSIHRGEWKRNMKNGFGKYFYENGDIYEGTWKDDKKHGVGTYTYKLSDISFKATWIDGSLKGPIEIDFRIFRYHGYWKDNDSVGEGNFTFDTKYMLPGHVERVFRSNIRQPGSNESFKVFNIKGKTKKKDELITSKVNNNNNEDQRESDEIDGKCVPRFVAHEILVYDYSKLPQQPFSLPCQDSETALSTKESQSVLSTIDISKGDERTVEDVIEDADVSKEEQIIHVVDEDSISNKSGITVVELSDDPENEAIQEVISVIEENA